MNQTKQIEQIGGLSLGRSLYKLYKEGKECDFKIITGDVSVNCHRLVLMSNCKYFERMLGGLFADASKNEIDLSESIPPELLLDLVRFLYIGHISLTKENAIEWVILADMLDLLDVVSHVKEWIIKHFSNVELFEISLRYSNRDNIHSIGNLLSFVTGFFNSSAVEYSYTPEFNALDFDSVVHYLSRDRIWIPHEKFVFEAALRWVSFKQEERKEMSLELIDKVVRLKEIPVSCLKNEILAHPIPNFPEKVQQAIRDATRLSTRCNIMKAHNTIVRLKGERKKHVILMYDYFSKRSFCRTIKNTPLIQKNEPTLVHSGDFIYRFGGPRSRYQRQEPNDVEFEERYSKIDRYEISQNAWTVVNVKLPSEISVCSYSDGSHLSAAVNRSGRCLVATTVSNDQTSRTTFTEIENINESERVKIHHEITVPHVRKLTKMFAFVVAVPDSDELLVLNHDKLMKFDPVAKKLSLLPSPISGIIDMAWTASAEYLFVHGARKVMRYAFQQQKWTKSTKEARVNLEKLNMFATEEGVAFTTDDGLLRHEIGHEKFI